MKRRILASLIVATLSVSMISGCAKDTAEVPIDTADTTQAPTDTADTTQAPTDTTDTTQAPTDTADTTKAPTDTQTNDEKPVEGEQTGEQAGAVIIEEIVNGVVSAYEISDKLVNISIDGVQMTGFSKEAGQPVVIKENDISRTLVPARLVYEELGFDVIWDEGEGTATLKKTGMVMTVKLGAPFITVNGERKAMDTSSKTIGGRTMLPLRAPLEAAGYFVKWDSKTSTAMITSAPQ